MLHIDKSVFCALHTLTTLVTCFGHIPLPHWLHVWGTYPHHTGYMFGAPLHFTHLCLHTPSTLSTYIFYFHHAIPMRLIGMAWWK